MALEGSPRPIRLALRVDVQHDPRHLTPVATSDRRALLLIFGESFRAAMDGTIVQKDVKISIILINITDARRGEYIHAGP